MDFAAFLEEIFFDNNQTSDIESRAAHALNVLASALSFEAAAIWRITDTEDKPLGLSAWVNAQTVPITHTPDLPLESLPSAIDGQPFVHQGGMSLIPPAPTDRGGHLFVLPLGLDQPPVRYLILLLNKPTLPWPILTVRQVCIVLGLWLGDARHSEAAWQRLMLENQSLRGKLGAEYGFPKLIGNSQAMRMVYEQVAQVAPAETTVLLRGESGTGKELIAEAIHRQSIRQNRPFIRVNCAAIPETLIESEFFGHERGAFTGAMARKKGRFELADGGTLFLDEIGELSPQTQAKLLRVLQEQTFERVGGIEPIKVHVRMIAATHVNLEEAIQAGQFREDLYYRLNVFSIYLPALKERRSDILLLADHFLFKYARKHGKTVQRISTPAIDALMRYHWPGNVRELENVIERAVLVCQDQVIHGYHLPPTLQTPEGSNTLPQLSFSESVALHEKELIIEALKASRGNMARAARMLQLTERIIGYKIQKYKVDVSRYKP